MMYIWYIIIFFNIEMFKKYTVYFKKKNCNECGQNMGNSLELPKRWKEKLFSLLKAKKN